MTLIRNPHIWTRQPQHAVGVNNRFAPNFLITAGSGLREAVTGAIGSLSSASIAPAAAGKSLLLDGASGFGQFASHPCYDITGALTLVWVGTLTDHANYNMLVTRSTGNGTANNPFEFRCDSGSGLLTLTRSNTNYSQFASASAAPTGRRCVLIVTHGDNIANAGGLSFYIDGVAVSGSQTVSFAASSLATGNAEPLFIGKRADGYFHKGSTELIAGFSRIISPAEARQISENVNRLFSSTSRTILIPTAGSGALNASASGAAQAGGSAAAAVQVALAAIGVATASGTANAGAAVPLSAAGVAVAGGGADLTATVTISAAGLAQAAGQAGLSAAVLLAGAGAAQAAGNATLAAQLQAMAAGGNQAGGTATLSSQSGGQIAASGWGVASGSAALSIAVQLQAIGGAVAGGSASGTASAPGSVSASGGSAASGTGALSASVEITAAGFVQAMGSGQLAVSIPLSASGNAIAGGSATVMLGQITVRAPSGPGPQVCPAHGRRPGTTNTTRPAATGGRRQTY